PLDPLGQVEARRDILSRPCHIARQQDNRLRGRDAAPCFLLPLHTRSSRGRPEGTQKPTVGTLVKLCFSGRSWASSTSWNRSITVAELVPYLRGRLYFVERALAFNAWRWIIQWQLRRGSERGSERPRIDVCRPKNVA